MTTLTKQQIKLVVREFRTYIRYEFPDMSFSNYLDNYHFNPEWSQYTDTKKITSSFSDYEKDLISEEFKNMSIYSNEGHFKTL